MTEYTLSGTSVYTAYHSPQIVYVLLSSINHMGDAQYYLKQQMSYTRQSEELMIAQIQDCLIQFMERLMSLAVEKTSFLMDDELPYNVINTI